MCVSVCDNEKNNRNVYVVFNYYQTTKGVDKDVCKKDGWRMVCL